MNKSHQLVPPAGSLRPQRLSPRQWYRLVSMAGLPAEHWGEGWLALERLYREHDGDLTEDLAVAALRSIADREKAATALRRLTA